jgi:hypothetical protein
MEAAIRPAIAGSTVVEQVLDRGLEMEAAGLKARSERRRDDAAAP